MEHEAIDQGTRGQRQRKELHIAKLEIVGPVTVPAGNGNSL